jgi:UDP-N-acetylglucosamine 2-epimerase (non-hydrolysing)
MKKVLVVVGTRPNFIKVTRFREEALKHPGLELKIVHTGQHYDAKMADVFFEQFGLTPDFFLNIGQGSAVSQMAEIMKKLETLLIEQYQADLVVVVGDVNSTFAAALAANKLGIKIAHVESGLRSFDKTMPEEHNRVLTDAITDLFFVTEQSGLDNLRREGIPEEKIHFVGNSMIDTLVSYRPKIDSSSILEELKLQEADYVLMTMHRPATVDDEAGLRKLTGLVQWLTSSVKLVFPVHPRTLKNLQKLGLYEAFSQNPQVILTEPLDYFSFQKLIVKSRFIVTDSGGIQEESTFVGIPCLTLRPNTERPVTCETGTNTLVPFDLELIKGYVRGILAGTYKKGKVPPLWDGQAASRIFNIIDSILK